MTDTFERLAFPVVADAGFANRVASAEVRGHAAGYAAGLRVAHAETEALRVRLDAEHAARSAALEAETARRVAALVAATDALLARTVPVLESAEQSVVDAAMELADAAVGYAIRASRPDSGAVAGAVTSLEARPASGAEATVRRALALVDHAVAIAVRLSPDDAAAVAALDLPVAVRADPTLADGDAVVDLPDGVLDARIGVALDRAKAALGVSA